jgi:hypothetical protein
MAARPGVHLLLLALAVVPQPAGALWDDQLRLYAAQAAYRDDNVLRQPEDAGPASDTYRVTSAGFELDVRRGQQRLLGGLRVDNTRYDTFGQLDLDGHDGRAEWQWRASRAVAGKLGFGHRRALASLASVQAGVQSTVPNAITTRRAYAESGMFLAPRWELELRASRLDETNSAAERRANDVVRDAGAATLSYVSRAVNRAGARLGVARGELPNAQEIGAARVDNSYRDAELGLVLSWALGEKTGLQAGAGRFARDYDELPQRDFDFGTWRLALDWAPTGKLALALAAERGLSSTEEIHVSAVLAERIGLYPRYAPSAKTDVSALLETSKRRYLGDAAVLLGAAPARAERVSAAGLLFAYRPLPRLQLALSLRREKRSPETGVSAYAVDLVGLELRLDL